MKKSLLIIACLIYTLAAVSQGQVDFNAELLWKLKRLNGGVVNTNASSVLFTATSFDMEKDAGTFLDNRVEGALQKIKSRHSPLVNTLNTLGRRNRRW
jgi:hypothetical protein